MTEPLGATPLGEDGCRFAVWAPRSTEVRVRLEAPGGAVATRQERLEAIGRGYHVGVLEGCPPGTRYRYLLDDDPSREGGALAHRALADPASRSQPEGVHGPSEVFDAGAYRWGDAGFVAPPLWQYVIYELHVGTFTGPGTFAAAAEHLGELAELGVTAIEVMPVAQFPGRWNWGYDGVFPYAAQDSYGGPAGLQRFADACHRHGMALVLDVVYNHLGPEGNVLDAFGPYFTDAYRTPWGTAINFAGPGSDEVRRYFIDNALGWFRDFHVDALRLDAVHDIVDPTASPFLAELSGATAELGEALGRRCVLIAESADNDPGVVSSTAAGGLGLDAQWNDDFHHALHAVLTGERAGYYEDFGRLDQLARAMTDGFVYQGEHSAYRGRRHGASSAAIEPERLVIFAQNHDHVGNRPAGDRLARLVSFDSLRLAAAVLLLAPGVPLLFMGDEYGETAPFPFFVDHGDPALSEAVRTGRAEEMAELGLPGAALDPTDKDTRQMAVLDRSLRAGGDHRRLWELYATLIGFRRRHPLFARSRRPEASAHAVGPVLTLVRSAGSRRAAALFNFDRTEVRVPLPDPPPGAGGHWTAVLDSGQPELAGVGPGAGAPTADDGGGTVSLAGLAFGVYEWIGAYERTGTHERDCGQSAGKD